MKEPIVDLSTVVVTWNSEKYIPDCLASLLGEQIASNLEIVVVDNGSKDNTVGIIQRDFPQVRLLMNCSNLGFTRACNMGIQDARGRYVLLLNPDTVVRPGSLESMIQYMEAYPRVGALGPQLLYPDGRIQSSCRQFPTYRLMLWEFTGLRMLFPRSHLFGAWRMGYFDHRQLRSVNQPMGACLFLRRSACEEIGALDERFDMFFNDVDLCRRLKSTGWDIIFYPRAQVVHDAGSHIHRVRRRMIVVSHYDCYRYFRKYRSTFSDHVNCLLLGCGLLISLPLRLLIASLVSLFSSQR